MIPKISLEASPIPDRGWFEPQQSTPPRRLDILMVEDDAGDANLILTALMRHPNVEAVEAVNDPVTALDRLATGELQPDLVLLDIHMPRLNGFEFLTLFRQAPATADTPVVFLTTSSLTKDVVGAWRSSASQYVIKPDSYAELRIKLDEVVQRALSGAWGR